MVVSEMLRHGCRNWAGIHAVPNHRATACIDVGKWNDWDAIHHGTGIPSSTA